MPSAMSKHDRPQFFFTVTALTANVLLVMTGCGNAGNTGGAFVGWAPDGVSTQFSTDARRTAPSDTGGPVTTRSDAGGGADTGAALVDGVAAAGNDAAGNDAAGNDAAGNDAAASDTTAGGDPLDAGATKDADNGSGDGGFGDSGAGDTTAAGAGDATNNGDTTGSGTSDVVMPKDSASGYDTMVPPTANDKDGDGYTVAGGDCDDNDPKVNPAAKEICNGQDTDCTGIPDDIDMDGDGFSVCSDDCDDTDININPQAGRDCKNGKDNDCSGIIDAQEDGDGDGFKGCADCDDYDKNVNSGSFELAADMIDNDCDGSTDEVPQACDTVALNTNNIAHYAKAIDLCTGVGTAVLSSTFKVQAANNARAIKTSYGTNLTPKEGKNMVVLSSGVAAAKGQAGYKVPQSGSSFLNSAPYPNVKCKNSGTVYDYTEWVLKLKVPTNVQAFSFEFNFMSSEYPEWVGSKFNDKFLAILDSKKFKGNVSFDSKGSCISINNAFFTVCNKCAGGDTGLLGTGYEGGVGGGTGWLTTTSPVTPGETITLRFIVFDEGDHILDSAVILDNFRWQTTAATGGVPSTVRPGG